MIFLPQSLKYIQLTLFEQKTSSSVVENKKIGVRFVGYVLICKKILPKFGVKKNTIKMNKSTDPFYTAFLYVSCELIFQTGAFYLDSLRRKTGKSIISFS